MGNKQGKHDRKLQMRQTGSTMAIGGDEEVGAFLKTVPLLKSYSTDELAKVGALLQKRNFAKGKFLVKQGDIGDGFFIIRSGTCTVLRSEAGGAANKIGELKTGDYFGETALLNNQLRGASVQAVSDDVLTFFLQRDAFEKLFGKVRFAKRVAVSAEQFKANDQNVYKEPKNAQKKKTKDQVKLIKKAVAKNMLFTGLTSDVQTQVIQEMYEKSVKKGEHVIKQGERGDHFYVVESGTFNIFVDDNLVTSVGASRCFGELALMYNAPRAASVVADSDAKLWCITRVNYREQVASKGRGNFSKYTGFLSKVDLLAPLTHKEREVIADALEEKTFSSGDTIFEQGSEGDIMYIVQQGEVEVIKDGASVALCKAGDIFGERALLKNDTRAATCMATGGELVICLTLNKQAFEELLGPLEDHMEAVSKQYDQAMTLDEPSSVEVTGKKTNLRFDQLNVIGTLGKGSFGHVQLVKDPSNNTYALKAVSKAMIVETGQQGHIMSEKKTMDVLNHPFLINLFQTFKDRDRLYFLLEPVLGGELFTLLRANTVFNEQQASFYAACVVSAFEYMHSKDIIYRDLKPENLLLDDKGFIKITDFGFAKTLTAGRTWTLCGTPDYLAPEIVAGKGHGKGVDWWTLGILIYEMLASQPPFYDDDPMRTYAKIVTGDITFPSSMSAVSQKLIKKLLHNKPTKRLGVLQGGAKKIKKHQFFDRMDWNELEQRNIKTPYVPTIKDAEDLSNFEDLGEEESNDVEQYVDDGSNWDDEF